MPTGLAAGMNTIVVLTGLSASPLVLDDAPRGSVDPLRRLGLPRYSYDEPSEAQRRDPTQARGCRSVSLVTPDAGRPASALPVTRPSDPRSAHDRHVAGGHGQDHPHCRLGCTDEQPA